MENFVEVFKVSDDGILTMQEIVKKVTNKLGFCPLEGVGFDGTLKDKVGAVTRRIEEHNTIMEWLSRERGFDANDYLIDSPGINTDYLNGWMKVIFGN